MDNIQLKEFENQVIKYSYLIYLKSEAKSFGALPKVEDNVYKELLEEEVNDVKDLFEYSQEVVQKNEVMDKLCPALKSISDDLKEISKVVVGVLLPLSLAPNLLIPLNPIIYSGIALIVFRAGVSSICEEYKKGKS